MRGTLNTWMSAGAFAALLLCGSAIAAARAESSQYGGQSQLPKQSPAPQNSKQPAPSSADATVAAPASAEEEAAYKAITDTPETESSKKIQLSEDFLQKYPQSRYKGLLYQALVSGYFATQQVAKLLDVGDKELAMNPNDAPVLAVMAQTIARSFNAKAPDAQKQLEKAEEYSKRAIEVTPTLPKPANLTDEAFATAKSDTLGMAHGGLGLVYVRKAKYAEAISELEESIKSDTRPQADPVNYYLLGLANDKTSHFSAAATAFTKCAAIQSSLQPTCKNLAEESKKHGETQLSAPN